MYVEVNYLAVLLAAVGSMVVGFLWYSPMLVGKPWMKLMGYTEKNMKDNQKKMGMMYGLSFVAALVTAYMLSHVMSLSQNYFDFPKLTSGFSSAFAMWLGFVAPVQMTDVIFAGKPWKLFFINTGYQLAALLVMGAVLGIL